MTSDLITRVISSSFNQFINHMHSLFGIFTIDFRTIVLKQGMKWCNRSVHDSKKITNMLKQVKKHYVWSPFTCFPHWLKIANLQVSYSHQICRKITSIKYVHIKSNHVFTFTIYIYNVQTFHIILLRVLL